MKKIFALILFAISAFISADEEINISKTINVSDIKNNINIKIQESINVTSTEITECKKEENNLHRFAGKYVYRGFIPFSVNVHVENDQLIATSPRGQAVLIPHEDNTFIMQCKQANGKKVTFAYDENGNVKHAKVEGYTLKKKINSN